MADAFRPVFVMGCPRSGTTLLTVILDRHSAFAATPETHFFPLTYLRSPGCTDPEELVRLFCENPRAADCELDPAALRQALAAGSASHASLLQAALTIFASQRGKPIVVEKTPDHLPFTPLLLDWYPEGRCVCIVRDGRDVVLSLKRVEWAHDNIYLHSLHWRYTAALAAKFEKKYAGRFRVIRYEDLLTDPQGAVSGLMDFLGAPFEEQQLAASATSHVIPEWERPWKEKAAQELDRSNVGRWRASATGRERGVMHAVMGGYLRHYGYGDWKCSAWSPWRVVAVGAELRMRLAFSPRFHGLRRLSRSWWRRDGRRTA